MSDDVPELVNPDLVLQAVREENNTFSMYVCINASLNEK